MHELIQPELFFGCHSDEKNQRCFKLDKLPLLKDYIIRASTEVYFLKKCINRTHKAFTLCDMLTQRYQKLQNN